MSEAEETVSAIAAATARDRLLIAARGGKTVSGSGDQAAALVDLARALNDAGIPYALIGGIAVGILAEAPRATMDVDIAVRSETPREELIAVLETAGFIVRGRFEHSINFRHATGEPVQASFDRFFDPMIERAESIDVSGVPVPIVTKPDLIATKERAAADPARRRSKALRDQADVELLRGDVPDPDEGW